MSATKLYTPEVLALAASLAAYPWTDHLPLQATARSKSCGSTVTLGLRLDDAGRIDAIGVRAHACAIGQSAAAIFAESARGRDAAAINAAADAIAAWLAGTADLPDWPGLDKIAPARAYPARHGAIMLAWNAAREVLPSTPQSR